MRERSQCSPSERSATPSRRIISRRTWTSTVPRTSGRSTSCELRDPGCVTLLAEDGVAAVGFAQLRLAQPVQCLECVAPAELQRIYLVATWQGRGLARQLMARVFAAAAAANAHCLWLGVWEHNPRALAFYAKLGFGIIGDHSFMLGTLMQRDLVMVAPVAAQPR